ncbi:hypothetical protein [Aminobacter niigataensis]|uniref:hypothetical protein n=1 Tax=Aminobacter niigataensis TaxID=83265 RepID=UPI0024C5B626|nr:hypothetical protein [Aminobacter niigataensis]CAI2931348.1 conserved protein of unknown function [Aminobacter niigataensis]
MVRPALSRMLLTLSVVLAAGLTGCAYVTAVPVKPGSKVSGIRIYDVKPILIVNGAAAAIHIVPNYNRAYALQFGAFLAKNDFTATMTNGVLSEVHANMDSTEFISFLKELLKTVEAKGLSGEVQRAPNGGIQDRFQVFDFVFDHDGNLVALRPLISQPDLLHVKTTQVVRNVVEAPVTAEQPDAGGITPGPLGAR